MDPHQFARELVYRPSIERGALIAENLPFDAVLVADALQALCYEVWTDDPTRVILIHEVFEALLASYDDEKVRGYAAWVAGIKALVAGELEACIEYLDKSERIFAGVGSFDLAARTQPSKLYALALLGRYNEAVSCGLRARSVFEQIGDIHSVGKIEHNIGNLYWRRDRYDEAAEYLEFAMKRFEETGDERQQAMVENSLAFALTLKSEFERAESLYIRALDRAERNALKATRSEIETGLSNLHLFKGEHDKALEYMRSARDAYEQLSMPLQCAVCDLEMAEIYLEISLLPEARRLYEKAAEYFRSVAAKSELARTLLGLGRVNHSIAKPGEAIRYIGEAADLFGDVGNDIGRATARLAAGLARLGSGDAGEALNEIRSAQDVLEIGGSRRHTAYAAWLSAECLAKLDRILEAKQWLQRCLEDPVSPEIEYLAKTSLGRLDGDIERLTQAAGSIETRRGILGAEDLRAAYFANRLGAHQELMGLNLLSGDVAAAFEWHERARARVLAESLGKGNVISLDPILKRIRQDVASLRRRLTENPSLELESRLTEAEARYAERSRMLEDEQGSPHTYQPLRIDDLRAHLGDGILIEYAFVGARLIAFVLSAGRFEAIDLSSETEVRELIRSFLFHLRSARIPHEFGVETTILAGERFLRVSGRAYERLIRALKIDTGRDLTIIPAGSLHAVPFAALHDGEGYLAEKCVISYAPSAAVLMQLSSRPALMFSRALIAGSLDESIPFAGEEIRRVGSRFKQPTLLTGSSLTREAFTKAIDAHDLVHIACHGRFRSDNPAFSSLLLEADELTAHDIRRMRLNGSVVVLSACESGVSGVLPGEELTGLATAFLAAGASSAVMALWRIDDVVTLEMMEDLYERLLSGESLAASMTKAQRGMISQGYDAYRWAPFAVFGKK